MDGPPSCGYLSRMGMNDTEYACRAMIADGFASPSW